MRSKPNSALKASPSGAPAESLHLPLLLLLGATAAAYVNSLALGFAMDAGILILDPRLREFTLENVQRILTGPYWADNPWAGLYRPVTTFSYLVNYSILGSGGTGPGYHAVNLLLHLANAAMAFALARRILGRPWVAWFTAAFWAIHPIGTESVTNVAGRADLLAASSVLGGLLWYVRRTERAGASLPGAAVLFLIALAGVFSKENAAVLAGVMLLWDLTYGDGRKDIRRRLPFYFAAVAPTAILLAARQYQPKMVVPLPDNVELGAGFLAARLTAVKVIGKYLQLLAAPVRLASDYSYNQVPVSTAADASAWLWALVIAAILAAAVFRRSRDPLLFFAAGWFGITLLPVSNLVILIGSIMAERFVYLPAFGFALATAALCDRAVRRWAAGKERSAAIVAAALLCVFAVRTAARNPDWNDDAALWSANLRTAPGSYKAYKNLASVLHDRGLAANLDEVTRLLETARAIVKDLPPLDQPENVLTDLGICYRLLGDRAGGPGSDAGKAWYRKSVDILVQARAIDQHFDRTVSRPADRVYGLPALYVNLANSHLNLGETAEALDAIRYAIRLEPRNPEFYESMAAVHLARQDTRSAAVALLQQWLVGVSGPDIHRQLGSIYAEVPGGESAFSGNSLNPQCPAVHHDLCAAGTALVQLLTDARRPSEAAAIRETARQRYGCAVTPVQR